MSSKEQSNLFGRITGGRTSGTPEQLLDKAHESALIIESIEKQFFNGGRVYKNAQAGFPQAEFDQNLKTLKQSLKAFNAKQAEVIKLSQDYMMKAIFAEGVLAKYVNEQPGSALVPSPSSGMGAPPVPSAPFSGGGLTTNNPDYNNPNYNGGMNVIEVPSVQTGKFTPDNSGSLSASRTSRSESKAKKKAPSQMAMPRSLQKTIDRISEDFNPDSEEQVLAKFRDSKAKTVIALRLLTLLLVVPLITQILTKNLLILPIVSEVRANAESAFINSEMKEEAFEELHTYEETLKLRNMVNIGTRLDAETIEERVKEKAIEIKEGFMVQSNRAISNIFADMISLVAFTMVLLFRRPDIAVLKSFIGSILYGLSDGAKAFAIILSTDLSVGFHSPHGWDVLLESLATHLGLAANHSGISLFIATVPVVADTGIKYWIFRSLSRISPSTVATLKEMND